MNKRVTGIKKSKRSRINIHDSHIVNGGVVEPKIITNQNKLNNIHDSQIVKGGVFVLKRDRNKHKTRIIVNKDVINTKNYFQKQLSRIK